MGDKQAHHNSLVEQMLKIKHNLLKHLILYILKSFDQSITRSIDKLIIIFHAIHSVKVGCDV